MFRFALLLGALATCAAPAHALDLRPDSVTFELDHISHATQHVPFTSMPTDYGSEITALVATWHIGPRVTFALSEGASLERPWSNPYESGYGALLGPREVFQARIAVTLWHK